MDTKKGPRITPALGILSLVVVLDQLTKILARKFLPYGESIPLWQETLGETFRLSHVSNDGAAFSFSPFSPLGNRIFFISVSIFALCLIAYLLIRTANRFQVFIYGLIMGGALGNLIDRILYGRVTDFIDVNFPDFIMERWPVFNIADSAIVIAMILLITELIIQKDPNTRKDKPLSQIDTENN